MAEKVLKVGMDREDGFLYYIDKDGDIARVQMARGGKKGGKPKKSRKMRYQKRKRILVFLRQKRRYLQSQNGKRQISLLFVKHPTHKVGCVF